MLQGRDGDGKAQRNRPGSVNRRAGECVKPQCAQVSASASHLRLPHHKGIVEALDVGHEGALLRRSHVNSAGYLLKTQLKDWFPDAFSLY